MRKRVRSVLPISSRWREIRSKWLILLVADAVTVEPVSAGKFAANREINREFLRKNREFVRENREFERAIEQTDFRMIFSEGTPHDDKEIAAACVDCCRT